MTDGLVMAFLLYIGIKNDTKYGDNFTEGEAFGHVRLDMHDGVVYDSVTVTM